MILVLVFVVGLLVMFAAGYQIAEKRMLAPKKRAEAIAPPPSDLPALACEALVTRVFEQRLVEAGIMEAIDMTTCDNVFGCKDCAPTQQAKIDKKKAEALAKQADKSAKQDELRIDINHNGKQYTFDWPKRIPTFASVHVDGSNTYQHSVAVVFKWTDPSTGCTMYTRQLFPTLQWEPPPHPGSDPVRRPMVGKSRAEAIAELGKNPPRPPKGNGGVGMTPERRARAIKSLTERR